MRTALALALVLAAACSKTDGSKAKQASPTNAMTAEPAAQPAPSDHAMPAEVPTVELPPPGTAPTPAAFSKDDPMWNAPIKTLRGKPMKLADLQGKALLLVNVASQCGNTPQYAALEALQKKYEAKGFSVVGFPCNQFGGQEPGTPEEIEQFCSVNYGITFPITEKIEVNGANRHPIYASLTKIADAGGHSGDIRWNFEKFVISADGTHITRFAPKIKPDDPSVIAAVEAALPR